MVKMKFEGNDEYWDKTRLLSEVGIQIGKGWLKNGEVDKESEVIMLAEILEI
jgi:hypothetical protein